MATTDDFLLADLAADPEHFGPDSGVVGLTHPTLDIDGDGALDSVVAEGEHATVVATDVDGDGDADRITFFADDGAFDAWEFHSDAQGNAHWDRIDEGSLDIS
ncbi:DUF6802 family protein [Rhodococcus sp. HNM0569]|uniref:DUF6802 family protein n=1 Tax=Rhodococcus sp. HNM0569 TaxID=2716340 RepID=UPI00146A281D|nr:DUF6802 family protein [Rhodococcus sp. HNM0569]NLU83707.1 hypothetical protein [Rhodococcus sp. HNM0569]